MSALGTKATELAERGLARHDREHVIATALERAGHRHAGRRVRLARRRERRSARPRSERCSAAGSSRPSASGITVGGFAATVSMKATQRRRQFDEQLPGLAGADRRRSPSRAQPARRRSTRWCRRPRRRHATSSGGRCSRRSSDTPLPVALRGTGRPGPQRGLRLGGAGHRDPARGRWRPRGSARQRDPDDSGPHPGAAPDRHAHGRGSALGGSCCSRCRSW